MYDLISDGARQRDRSRRASRAAYRTRPTRRRRSRWSPAGPSDGEDGAVPVPVTVPRGCSARCARSRGSRFDGQGDDAPRGLDARSSTFPGLRAGERLTRRTRARRPRGDPRPRDGTTLAAGPEPHLDRPRRRRRDRRASSGRSPRTAAPSTGRAGTRRTRTSASPASSGSSRRQLAGTPGGRLLAGARVLARSAPAARPRRAHHRSPRSRRDAPRSRRSAAATAGVAVLEPGTGEVLALAGVALLAPCSRPAPRSRSSRSPPRWRPRGS